MQPLIPDDLREVARAVRQTTIYFAILAVTLVGCSAYVALELHRVDVRLTRLEGRMDDLERRFNDHVYGGSWEHPTVRAKGH